MRVLSTKYGECIAITEYEIEKAGVYSGTPKRKLKIYKSKTVDPETGKVIREFDSPTFIEHKFDNAADAGKKAWELIQQETLFIVEYVHDGRSGDNHRSILSADLMWEFLYAFDKAGS